VQTRRLAAALHAWSAPAFRLWASVRVYELGKAGEAATVVVWFDKRAYDASQLERLGEPEYAVRRSTGAIERSPNAPAPPPALRVVYRRQA